MLYTLWTDNMILFTFIEAGFLVVFPLCKMLFMVIVWIWPVRPSTFVRNVKILRAIGKWAMIDVFVVGT